MGFGLLELKQQHENDALAAIGKVANEQEQNHKMNESLEEADRAQRNATVAMGAGTGMMIGMQAGSVGGPMGAVIGAAVGYLATELF